MPELFRAPESGHLEPVPVDPFPSELELETYVKDNPGLLGERVRVVAEQVDTGRGDRLDLLAIDESLETSQLLLVELKNVAADTNVLLQVLRYASWIMANPDSVRLLLQKQQIDTAALEIKPTIVIAAPEIRDEILELSRYTAGFQFSFIQVKRFRHGSERFVVVERKYPPGPLPPGVSVQEDWDWDKYQRDLKMPPTRVELGKELAGDLQGLIGEQGWDIMMRFRKYYIAFQLAAGGGWNVFGLQPSGKGWGIWVKLPSSPESLALDMPGWVKEAKWDEKWHQATLFVDTGNLDLSSLIPLLKTAYEHVRKQAGL